MSYADDPDGVLHHLVTDDDADRLITGDDDIADDSALLAPVASVVAALREPGRASELDGTDQLLAQMVEVVQAGGSVTSPSPRSKPVLARFTGKVAALTAASFVFAGAAAAATGSLPDVVQHHVAHTVSHIGVGLPDPKDRPKVTSTTAAGETTTTSEAANDEKGTPIGPDANGPAKHGLCTAYAAGKSNGHKLDSAAFRNLAEAAKAAGQDVATFCAGAVRDSTTTSASGSTTTLATETTATTERAEPTDSSAPRSSSDDAARPANPGNSGNTPAATAPGRTKDRGKPSTPDSSSSTPSSTEAAQLGQSNGRGNSGNTPGASAPGRTKGHGKPSASSDVGSTPSTTAVG